MISLKISEPKWAKAILSKCGLSLSIVAFTWAAHGSVNSTVNRSVNRAVKPHGILNLVTFFDITEGQVYNWWAENTVKGPMAQTALAINRFLPAEFYLHPQQQKVVLPEELKKTDLSAVEKLRLAKLYNAAALVSGDVIFSKSPLIDGGTRIKVQLKAQPLGGSSSEIVRIFDLLPAQLPALTSNAQNPVALAFMELHERMEKPASDEVDKNLELVVSGKLNYQEWERFKDLLQKNIRGIKKLQEVAFENEQVALRIYYSGNAGASSLSAALEKIRLIGFRTQVVSHDDERVFFDVKAKEKK